MVQNGIRIRVNDIELMKAEILFKLFLIKK
jgi:hypothetical protein